MKIKTESLILDLIERTRQNINQVEQLSQLTEKELNKKKNQVTWSVLECIEHLNLYGEFYIPEIEQKIEQSAICRGFDRHWGKRRVQRI